jgi:CO/xanthine dehydrogenase Mo-binding subunit
VGTHASRHAFISGHAILLAGEDLKRKVLELAAKWMHNVLEQDFQKKARRDPDFKLPELDFSVLSDPDNLDLQNSTVFVKSDPDNEHFQCLRHGYSAHMVGTGKAEMVVSEAFTILPTRCRLGRKGNLFTLLPTAWADVDTETGQ